MSLCLWEPPDKPQQMPDPEPENGGGVIVWLAGAFLFWAAVSLIVALIYLPK